MNRGRAMNIKILYDNRAEGKGILEGWGFSCLVDGSILFDTGEDGESLLHNMKQMGVDPAALEAVVISHDHWDHTGGLRAILEKKKGIRVYACPAFSEEFKENARGLGADLVEAADFTEVKDDVHATGRIRGEYKTRAIEEQALAVRTPEGITVITGCAHPGIVTIAEKVKGKFPGEGMYAVLGGFHLQGRRREEIDGIIGRLGELGFRRFGPAHCSGEEAISMFRERSGEAHMTIAAGKEFEV